MNFGQFWNAIAERNGWKPDDVIKLKVSSLQKLAAQAWEMGKRPERGPELPDWLKHAVDSFGGL